MRRGVKLGYCTQISDQAWLTRLSRPCLAPRPHRPFPTEPPVLAAWPCTPSAPSNLSWAARPLLCCASPRRFARMQVVWDVVGWGKRRVACRRPLRPHPLDPKFTLAFVARGCLQLLDFLMQVRPMRVPPTTPGALALIRPTWLAISLGLYHMACQTALATLCARPILCLDRRVSLLFGRTCV